MAERDFGARAENIKASRLLYRVDVIARVESEDDIPFWQKSIHSVRPNVKVKFIPAELSESNSKQRGKTLCMKYVGYLDMHLIICVDSDFDKFLHPELLKQSKYILQTHTYSWENHHCQASNLQRRWDSLNFQQFNFKTFLVKLGQILYPALVSMLTAKSHSLKFWRLDSLCSVVLDVHVNQKGMLDDNGSPLLQVIDSNVQAWMLNQVPINGDDYGNMAKQAGVIGMGADNAYLYMQGHCVYDLILRIGNALCDKEHNFKYEVLNPAFNTAGYDEIEKVKSDIAQTIWSFQ